MAGILKAAKQVSLLEQFWVFYLNTNSVCIPGKITSMQTSLPFLDGPVHFHTHTQPSISEDDV